MDCNTFRQRYIFLALFQRNPRVKMCISDYSLPLSALPFIKNHIASQYSAIPISMAGDTPQLTGIH